MKKFAFRGLCTFLAVLLAAFAPGLAPYEALAQVVSVEGALSSGLSGVAGAGAGRVSPGQTALGGLNLGTPSAGLGLGSTLVQPTATRLAPGGSAPLSVPVLAGVGLRAAPAAGAVLSAPAATVEAPLSAAGDVRAAAPGRSISLSPGAAEGRKARLSALNALSLPMPRFGSMGMTGIKDGADDDFRKRAGETDAARETGADPVSGAGQVTGRFVEPLRASIDTSEAPRKTPPAALTPAEAPRQSVWQEIGEEIWKATDWSGKLGWPLILATGVAIAAGGMTGVLPAAQLALVGIFIVPTMISLMAHEWAHAWWADKRGSPVPRIQGRLSFSLKAHAHPLYTILMPVWLALWTGIPFGFARPVRYDPRHLYPAKRARYMAEIAFMGPFANIVLAAAFGAAYAGAMAMGWIVLGPALWVVIFINALLFVANLVPLAPLDGQPILRWILKDVLRMPAAARFLDRNAHAQRLGVFALWGLMLFNPEATMNAFTAITDFFTTLPGLVAGAAAVALKSVGLAGAKASGAPVLAMALGFGWKAPAAGGDASSAAGAPVRPQESQDTVKLHVQFTGTKKPLSNDFHEDFLDSRARGFAKEFAATHELMLKEIEAAGLGRDVLSRYSAEPVGTYQRVNTAVLRLPEGQVKAFKAVMAARGYAVRDLEKREIVRPVPMTPELAASGAVTPQETLKVSTMDKLHDVAKGVFGPPLIFGNTVALGAARLLMRVAGAGIPQPPAVVIDSGLGKHKFAKFVKKVINVTTGANIDDIGHGTWVHIMVLIFAPWALNTTHVKAFVNGSGSNDDIMKALTAAANEKPIMVSNSWGDDEGNPDSLDAQMVLQMAKEGIVQFFAGGNAGPRPNTIGAPAIQNYRDPVSGAIRIWAVAAVDRNKRPAFFNSVGPGSPTTSKNPEKYKDWPRRPDGAEIGVNTESGNAEGVGRASRVDPVYGDMTPNNGTSMSTPKLAATFLMLAQLFGVVKVGKELDTLSLALEAALEKLANENATGKGFNVAYAAYQKAIEMGLKPVVPQGLAKFVLRLTGHRVGGS